jgi:uncharacterized protein YcnI
MRCSGWSSPSTLICRPGFAVLGCSVAALLVAAPAGAHVSINPARVQTGDLVDLVFSVPNTDDRHRVDHVTLGIPADFELDDAEAKSGWTQSRTGQAITWAGGSIPRRQFARFAIRGTTPKRAETILFNVLVGDRTGKSITYRVALDVEAHGPRDAGARSLGKTALALGVVAIALALAALFTGLYLWLRPPPP